MNFEKIAQELVDTRPYPESPNKNELLALVQQQLNAKTQAEVKLSGEMLDVAVRQMLSQDFYLSFSVALSMVTSATQYRLLWKSLSDALKAKEHNQVQFLVWPVILVLGSNQSQTLNSTVPVTKIVNLLSKQANWQGITGLNWLPQLIHADDFVNLPAGLWYQAQTSIAAAQEFIASLPQKKLTMQAGQEVMLTYAVAYGDNQSSQLLALALKDNALSLMQLWQEALQQEGVTLFANPLSCYTAADAHIVGSQMRKRMACDVFTTNAIRALRLQNQNVGVQIATCEGGTLDFAIQSLENPLLSSVFKWLLSPEEELAEVLQNLLELALECRIENIRILKNPLFIHEKIPSYQDSVAGESFNPLLESHE